MIRLLTISVLLFSLTLTKAYGQSTNLKNIYDAALVKTEEKQKSEKEYLASLMETLNKRGYYVSNKNKKVLDKYVILDSLLKSKYDALTKTFSEKMLPYNDVRVTTADETTSKAIRYSHELKDRQIELKKKYRVIQFNSTGEDFEADVMSIGNETDIEKIEHIVQTLQSIKEKQQQDVMATEQKELELQKAIASLPSREAIKSKFKTYKHKTGYTLEMFPIGFTPKAGKPVTDYVTIFSRKYKGRYREVDENGMNTFIIEYYDSGSILSVTVYKGGNSIYTANYRDHAGKPYEIRSTSSDGKFYLIHKRIYNTSEDKTNVTTRYQYVPLDYWYD